VPGADFFDDLFEFGDAFKPSQPVFEVFGNPQPRT